MDEISIAFFCYLTVQSYRMNVPKQDIQSKLLAVNQFNIFSMAFDNFFQGSMLCIGTMVGFGGEI